MLNKYLSYIYMNIFKKEGDEQRCALFSYTARPPLGSNFRREVQTEGKQPA